MGPLQQFVADLQDGIGNSVQQSGAFMVIERAHLLKSGLGGAAGRVHMVGASHAEGRGQGLAG